MSAPAQEAAASGVDVRSEIGRLRRVLVHEPGVEVDRMVPSMMEELLFDDILFGDRAREEHGRFRRVMQLLGVEVLEAQRLLVEALARPAARAFVLAAIEEEMPAGLRERARAAAPESLADLLVGGATRQAAAAGTGAEGLFDLPPLPNWCFQRDPQVVLGRSVVHGTMASTARRREGLLARTIFRFHPRFEDTPVLFDAQGTEAGESRRLGLEGGDLQVLSGAVIVAGCSERTRRATIVRLAEALARREGAPRWMVVVDLPERRAFMHLDTVFTQVDRDACLVYPPVVLPGGRETAAAYEVDLHAASPGFVERGDLLAALAGRGIDLEPIPCGGDDPIARQREQWTDGANGLALAPGIVAVYGRNAATAEELDRRGFRIVEAEALLLGREEASLAEARRVALLLPSHELSRARGGPHCLVHPLVRDAAE